MGIYIQYIYIQKSVVLASESVGGRSQVTELPCFILFDVLKHDQCIFDIYTICDCWDVITHVDTYIC